MANAVVRNVLFSALVISTVTASEFPEGSSFPIPTSDNWPLGLGWPIDEVVNPAFDLQEVDLGGNQLVMGMDFLSDGSLVLILADYQGHDVPTSPRPGTKIVIATGTGKNQSTVVREISNSWLNPGGVTVVDDEIYVSDRDAFYKIINHEDPPGMTGNRTKLVTWPEPEDGEWSQGYQWHQWAYTPMFWQGHFYSPYAGSIRRGGRSDVPATSDLSGAFLKWNKEGGPLEGYAGGLRSPNGSNIDHHGNMLVADNQGGWLPVSTIALMKPGKFYGHRQNDNPPNFAEDWPYEPPVAWLSHDIMGASPTQPLYLRTGAYSGDWVFGDINHLGLKRLALDTVEGNLQGAVVWLTRGTLNSAINRLAQGEDGSIYIGTHGQVSGNWPSWNNRMPFYRLDQTGAALPFEVRRVISRSTGVELVFTAPVDEAAAGNAGNYAVEQWQYVRRADYGGFPVNDAGQGNTGDQHDAYNGFTDVRNVTSVQVSPDKYRVFLELQGMKEDRLTYIEYTNLKSAAGSDQWNNRVWYTMNKISASTPFAINGCTNAGYAEYNPAANFDNGSCATGVARQFKGADNLFSLDQGKDRSFSLEISQTRGAFKIKLLNTRGRVIERRSGSGASVVPFSSVRNPGVYLLQIEINGGTFTQKVIVP